MSIVDIGPIGKLNPRTATLRSIRARLFAVVLIDAGAAHVDIGQVEHHLPRAAATATTTTRTILVRSIGARTAYAARVYLVGTRLVRRQRMHLAAVSVGQLVVLVVTRRRERVPGAASIVALDCRVVNA